MFKLLHSKMNQELYKNTFATKVATMKNMNGASATPINYRLRSQVSITLLFQQFLTLKQYESKSISVIKVATMKNMDAFHYTCKGSHHVQPPN